MRIFVTVVLVVFCGLLCGCPQDDGYVAPWPQKCVETPDYDETLDAGPLRAKAEEYDAWHLKWHQPYHGGTVEIRFADDARTVVENLEGFGDSTIWTGTYLASQALRYYVTRDAQARTNAINMVNTLSGHLHVTGAPGYIARYWGSQTSPAYQGDAWCDGQERCFHIEEGEYAGDFWWGETSRDQYTGWFLGMSLAYDLVDDEPMRAKIRADVRAVVDMLMDHGWNITAEDGQPSSVAAQVIPSYRLAYITIGYHITGDERMRKELSDMLLDTNRASLNFADINFMNRYAQYYGNNLGHSCWYNTLRLGRRYFSADDYQWLVNEFNNNFHTFTRLSHNAWFNGIYMSQGGWEPTAADDPYLAQLRQDLSDFRPAPNASYYLPARDPATYALDPMSVFLNDAFTKAPFLADLMGQVNPQAEEAFPVRWQCTADFIWQRNPFRIEECGCDDSHLVYPGVDYLTAYWLASYHKFITKDK